MGSPRKCHTFMHKRECGFFGESLRGTYIVFKAELWEVRIGVIYPGLKLWKWGCHRNERYCDRSIMNKAKIGELGDSGVNRRKHRSSSLELCGQQLDSDSTPCKH